MLKDLSVNLKAPLALGVIFLALIVVVLSSLFLLTQQEADGLLVNVAGRQRMLSQKMTKEALLLATRQGDWAKGKKVLLATAGLFDKSLKALISGNTQMGIPPTESPAIKDQLHKVNQLWLTFSKAVQSLSAEPGPEGKNFQKALGVMVKNNLTLLKEMNKAVGMFADEAGAKVKNLQILLWVSLAFGAVMFGLISWGIKQQVVKPLGLVALKVELLSSGDLQPGEAVRFNKDEIGRVGQAVEDMRQSWSDRVRDILQGSQEVAAGASEIAQGNTDLTERTQSQAAAVEETASAVEQLSGSVRQNAENAHRADQLAQKAAVQAKEGGQMVERTMGSMQEVTESSKRIMDIISVVNEIAFQTNLLALNAAVEAARAGEAGRGFAVVAGEVRNLAGRSAKAAKEIQDLITDSVDKIEKGGKLVNQSGRTLAEIIENVGQVADTIAEITSSSNEQAVGIEEVNKAVGMMDRDIQNNAALVEQNAASAATLSDISQRLKINMEVFTV